MRRRTAVLVLLLFGAWGSTPPAGTTRTTFDGEIWVDNWFSVHVDGEVVLEDPVPITTERSFNAESFTFEAEYPFTLSVVARDFIENNTGLE